MLPELAELRARAWTRLSPPVRDYLEMTVDGLTPRLGEVDRASAAWSAFDVHPHVLRDVSEVRTATSVLGTEMCAPILTAPIGYLARMHPDGEIALARATARSGTIAVVSTRSTMRFEDVAATGAHWWLQVYLMRDRGLTEDMVDRAVAHGATALVLTGDTPLLAGQTRFAGALGTRPAHLVNLDVDPGTLTEDATTQDPAATPKDIRRLRERSGLPILVKGVTRPDDAEAMLDAGADGVVVSNHGRRQMVQVVDTAAVLRAIVDRVGDRAEVLVDGGLRDGASIVIALALGARAVMVGRPAVWGLAADGAEGVVSVLTCLRESLAHSMALVGASELSDLQPDLVSLRAGNR